MILEAANGGATKTKIMYKAFLSYAQLREYLSVLIENNLLEYLEGEVHGHDYEVEEARWFPLDEAFTTLSFATEQKMMRRAKRLIDSRLSRAAARGAETARWR